jgi:multidrug resistance protein MdtO
MATPASKRHPMAARWLPALLAVFPGRLEFGARLALICALTILVVEIYQTPEPALTAYVAFFLIKFDRATSVIVSIVMLLLLTLIIGTVFLITVAVIDEPLWRFTTMALISLCLLFAVSASKLKPIGGIIALIVAYAIDLLGTAHDGEVATRALLYAWLFVAIPAGVSLVVNLILGPPPRRLAERVLAHRLRLAAGMLRTPTTSLRRAFEECLHEGSGEIPAWLKLAGMEKTSPPQDIAALRQAAQSTAVILSLVDMIADPSDALLPAVLCERIAQTLDDMAAILREGGYPIAITLNAVDEDAMLSPLAAAVMAELRAALTGFAEAHSPDPPSEPDGEPGGGFFLPDAFTNPVHVQYALKTTAAAMFCYVVYSLLDWPGIHTSLITCYIVSLGTTAETVEKLTLRILGCLVGAAAGIAAIVFLIPIVTSIGALIGIVALAAFVSGWIAAGDRRISYVGFQLAFAFFLCVVQGSGPAFDMTIARDRVIGILFGNLVVAVISTLISPVSVAERIDPAVAVVLRKLGAMAVARSRAKRWRLAAETQTALGAIEQDIDLTVYEPVSIRPTQGWIDRRRKITHALASLQGPLLVGSDLDPEISDGIVHRLNRLVTDFHAGAEPTAAETGAGSSPRAADMKHGSPAPGVVRASIEGPLAKLEQAIAQTSENAGEGDVDYARA